MKALITFLLVISLIETVSYPGYFLVHFHLSAIILYLIGFTILSRVQGPKPSRMFLNLLGILASTSSLLFFVFSFLESLTYENYIFSHLHINLKGFTIFTLISILSYYMYELKIRRHLPLPKQMLKSSLAIYLLLNLASLAPFVTKNVISMARNGNISYEEKMNLAYPGFFPAMQFVKDLTPESATIVIPPQGAPWVTEGNSTLVRRFLYPRNIVHESGDQPETYYLISRGSWPPDGTFEPGWPKTTINAKKLWKFDINTNETHLISGDYSPNYNWDWGLIEVNHE